MLKNSGMFIRILSTRQNYFGTTISTVYNFWKLKKKPIFLNLVARFIHLIQTTNAVNVM